MRSSLVCLLLLSSAVYYQTAAAGQIADVEVYDLVASRSLPIYHHEGRAYVVGEPQHQYELRIRSRAGYRLLAVASVDGVNVVTGQTAGELQSGYVIDPGGVAVIEGWRKSFDDVATFYFTALEDSYAARTGRPSHVGVIGVALFREKGYEYPCCERRHEQLSRQEDASASAPKAPSDRANTRGAQIQSKDELDSGSAHAPLGTGHGHREYSPAQQVDFQRASTHPNETIVLYYDSYRNLAARGIIPREKPYARALPDPFPQHFVPDP